jgi:hypothetical protein
MISSMRSTLSTQFEELSPELFKAMFNIGEECVGSGTFGMVYKGHHEEFGQVALKKYNKIALTDKFSILNEIKAYT